jgi:hypothetical protein
MMTYTNRLLKPKLWRFAGLAFVAAFGMASFGLAYLIFKATGANPLPDFILQGTICLTGIFCASMAFDRMKEMIV